MADNAACIFITFITNVKVRQKKYKCKLALQIVVCVFDKKRCYYTLSLLNFIIKQNGQASVFCLTALGHRFYMYLTCSNKSFALTYKQ
ncbi:hypothetical protein BEL04_14625 [Mucilaginibacter sp. PPCGB 2223]|nr:hypothetical protein BEL04_14625 [Mucilaginibacter sp. PPCGB 2223]